MRTGLTFSCGYGLLARLLLPRRLNFLSGTFWLRPSGLQPIAGPNPAFGFVCDEVLAWGLEIELFQVEWALIFTEIY
jgi:hypothetical protein